MTREEMIARQQAIVAQARAAHRDLTDEEQREFDELQSKIESAREEENGAASAANEAATREAAVVAERQRIGEITNMCRDFGVDPEKYIADGTSVDAVRAAVLTQLKANNGPMSVRVQADEADKFRSAATDALLIRGGVGLTNPVDGARELAGMSLRDLGIECLSRDGANINSLLRMSSEDLYSELCRGMYNPSASFPAILDAGIKKSIVEEYQKVPTTFQTWTTKGSLPDFKQTSDKEYIVGGTGDFLIVPENGELKSSTPSTQDLPQRKLDTYGRQFSMTRQAFVNDDIGFITKVPGLYAVSAKKTIDKQVYTALYNNSTIYDGKTLFHTDHKNLMASAEKPNQASIQAAILQMQKQTDPFGDPIYMTPKYLVVPMGYEFDLAVLFGSTQATGSSNNDINPLYNYPITVVQSPVLNALAGNGACPWFIVADPYSAKGIQVDYLNGVETPTVRRMEAPGVLGFTWDIYLDWGIAVRDYRGITKNPGVTL